MDWGDLPEDEAPPAKAEIVPSPSTRLQQLEAIQAIEDEIYLESMAVVRDAVNFTELDPVNDVEPPAEWVEQLGKKEAWKRFRRMQAAWMNTKAAPVGLQIAASQARAEVKARALKQAAPKTLNILYLPGNDTPRPVFEVRDVDSD